VIILTTTIESLTDRFKMLSDKTRLLILAHLRERDLCVSELVQLLQVSQPGISQHLKKLKQLSLVIEKRNKQSVYYHLNKDKYPELILYLVEIPSFKKEIELLGS
jgi:ArsR family transcriptional regulator